GSVVSLTRWLPNLTDVVVPAPWRSEDGHLRPLRATGGELTNRSRAELVDLVQWTDLILFDYLTANFDRLSVCVFRERTARRVLELHRGQDAAARLLRLYQHHEPRFPELAALADPHAQLLQRRLDFLAKHILHCKAKAVASATARDQPANAQPETRARRRLKTSALRTCPFLSVPSCVLSKFWEDELTEARSVTFPPPSL
ncbi:hypothetical protein E2I00_002306, partial [Balaenoptera physalus]